MISAEHYRLSLRTLSAVATGAVEASDLGLLESAQRSRLLLALAGIHELSGHAQQLQEGRPRDNVPPTRPATAWALLGSMQRSHPAAVEAVLRDPMVSAWALQLLRRLGHGAVVTATDASLWAETALIGSLTAAVATRAGTRCSLRVPARRGRLWLPSLGLTGKVARGEWAVVGVECGSRGTVVFGDGGSVRLPDDLSRSAEGWAPLTRIDAPGESGTAAGVVLDHLSPHRDFRALSDPVELTPATLQRWHELVHDACELLCRKHPAAHRMVLGTVRSLVPVDQPSPARPISVTLPDAYGVIMMSLPGDASAMATTLIHEACHQLMAAVADLTPLFVPVRDGPEPLYFAPWREDPRPLRGLFYGAHAFAGVTAFWHERRRHEGDRADFEFAFHRWQLRTALAALRNATGLAQAGGHIVTALARLAASWWADPVEGTAGRLAELCCRDIRAGWRAAHLTVRTRDGDALARRWLDGGPPPLLLPAARLKAARPLSRAGARVWLARLSCTDRQAFDRLRSDLGAGGADSWGVVEVTPADAALVAGDHDEARALFRGAEPIPGKPPDLGDWIGRGLATSERGGPLVERPELVLALHTALIRSGAQSPGPEELAQWLGRPLAAGNPPSHAEHVDIAVGST